MEALKKELAEDGFCPGKLENLSNPAGLDIKARTPQEIALSILAEVIQQLRSKESDKEDKPAEIIGKKFNDPVCDMTR